MFYEIKSKDDFVEALTNKELIIMIGYFSVMFAQVIEDKSVLRFINYLIETNETTISDVEPIPNFEDVYNDFVEDTLMYKYSGDRTINEWKEILDDFKDDPVLDSCTNIFEALELKKISKSKFNNAKRMFDSILGIKTVNLFGIIMFILGIFNLLILNFNLRGWSDLIVSSGILIFCMFQSKETKAIYSTSIILLVLIKLVI